MADFQGLIEEAREEQIRFTLGFRAWPVYIADVIGKEMGQLAAEERRNRNNRAVDRVAPAATGDGP
jgi:hypothetical protein